MDLSTPCHTEHDAKWTIHKADGSAMCLACIVKVLEDPDGLVVQKRPVLNSLLRMLHSHKDEIAQVLSWDFRVLLHICVCLLGLLTQGDDAFSNLIIEVVTSLVCCLKSGELVNCLLDAISQECLKTCDYKSSLPLLSLTGKLLYAVPGLGVQLLQCYGSLVDYMCAGLTHSDAVVGTAVSYALLPLYSEETARDALSTQMSGRVVQGLMHGLVTSNNRTLQMNLLGLLKMMLNCKMLCDLVLSPESPDQPSLPAILKKLFLTRHDVLQVAAVQCLVTVLQSTRGQHCVDLMLANDIAEFLFETLASTNELLIGSVFCALNLLTISDVFFSKCHTVYGIESLLTSLENTLAAMSPDVTCEGFRLVACILNRHDSAIRLFSSAGLTHQCMKLIERGVQHNHTDLSDQAVQSLLHIISKTHLTSPLPLTELRTSLEALLQRTSRRVHMLTGRTGSRRKSLEQKTKLAQSVGRVICTTLHVVHNTCRLLTSVLNDPLADASQVFGAPCLKSPTEEPATDDASDDMPASSACRGHLNSFCDWLLSIVDVTCVPLVMGHHTVNEDEVFAHLTSILTSLHTLCPKQFPQLTKKLVQSGFFSLILPAASQHSDCVGLGQAVWQCVACMTCTILETVLPAGDNTKNYIELISHSINDLQGRTFEGVLASTSLDRDLEGSSNLPSLHAASIDLHYVTYMLGHPLLDGNHLLGVLEGYLSSEDQVTAAAYQPPTLKLLISLCASCCQQNNQALCGVAMERLMSAVHTNCQSPQDWCSRDPHLLAWIFSDPRLVLLSGSQLLTFLLSADEEDSNVRELAVLSDFCVTTLLDILASPESKLYSKVKSILRHILLPSDTDMKAKTRPCLQSHLTDTLQMALLTDEKPTEESLCGMLELMSLLFQTKDAADGVSEQEMKLLYHIQKLLIQGDNSWVIHESIMTYLVSMLHLAHLANDNRVGVLLLSCPDTISCLQRALQVGSRSGAEWFLLSHLLISYTCNSIKVAGSVEVWEEDIINILNSSSCSSPVVCGGVWTFLTALFWSHHSHPTHPEPSPSYRTLRSGTTCHTAPPPDSQPGVVQVSDEDRERLVHVRCKSDPTCVTYILTTDTIRSLYLLMQQSLLMENPGIQLKSAMALWSLLNFLRTSNSKLRQHLLWQPWNQMLVCVGYSAVGPASPLPLHLILITYLMLEEREHPCILREHMEELLRDYLSTPDNSTPTHQSLFNHTTAKILKMHSKDLDTGLTEACKQKLKGSPRQTVTFQQCFLSLVHTCQPC